MCGYDRTIHHFWEATVYSVRLEVNSPLLVGSILIETVSTRNSWLVFSSTHCTQFIALTVAQFLDPPANFRRRPRCPFLELYPPLFPISIDTNHSLGKYAISQLDQLQCETRAVTHTAPDTPHIPANTSFHTSMQKMCGHWNGTKTWSTDLLNTAGPIITVIMDQFNQY